MLSAATAPAAWIASSAQLGLAFLFELFRRRLAGLQHFLFSVLVEQPFEGSRFLRRKRAFSTRVNRGENVASDLDSREE
jgi:hypothetical protein